MRYLLLIGLSLAQEAFCGLDGYERWLLEQDPDLRRRQALIEAEGATFSDPILRTEPACTPSRHVIPVVFHVIYSSASDSVSHQRIWRQLWRLHEDFRRIPETIGYSGSGVDTEIEFSLATKAPNGRDTIGIVYWKYDQPPLNWSSRDFCRESQDLSMKTATAWDPTRYLNIWIVPRLCVAPNGTPPCDPNNCGGVAGYAFFPSASTNVYGSVIGERYFWGSGVTGRSTRTTVHELGHNLNLHHPFNNGCGGSNCGTTGDGVCDTPPTSGQNFSVVRQNTCINDNPDRPDNTRNIMDYVADPDMTHFTAGQRSRSWSAINSTSSRLHPLTRPTNQSPTGTGPHGFIKAYFTGYPLVACVGQPIQFYGHYSYGMPHIYEWDFDGGTANNPTSACPTVTFPTPGTYSVRLIVENLSGRRDTLIKTNYITIYDTITPVPYYEGFEGTAFPPQYSYIDNPDIARSGSTWERFRGTSPNRGAFGLSPTCMRLRFFSYSHYREKDSWVTPVIGIPALGSGERAFLRFAHSYACLDYENPSGSRPSSQLDYVDSLRAYVSTDCGMSWTLIWQKGGRDLATTASQCITVSGSLNSSHQFLPTASEWDSVEIDLSAYSGQTIKLRLEGVSGWGNNLYVDDIRVDTTSQVSTGLPSIAPHVSAALRSDAIHFVCSTPLSQAHLRLHNMLGQVVWSYEAAEIPSGTHTWPLSTALPGGVYVLRLESANHTWNGKLVP